MGLLTPCEHCEQLFEREGEVTWCRPCLDNRWRQESEALRLFAPVKAEIPGQVGLDLGEEA